MNPKEFVEKYKPDALKIQEQTGMLAEVILAQAAWESMSLAICFLVLKTPMASTVTSN